MKVGDIVIAPEGCKSHLTPNKEYPVIGIWDDDDSDYYGIGFIIKDDENERIDCLQKYCGHLNNNNWILKPTTHEKVKDDKTIKK